MLAYSEYTYQMGLIDLNAKNEMLKLETQGKKAIQDKHYIDAFYVSMTGIRFKCYEIPVHVATSELFFFKSPYWLFKNHSIFSK